MKNRLFSILTLFIVAVGCNTPQRENEDGKILAKSYCGSCHQVPLPDELDKNTWLTGVLPQMGPRLGINSFQGVNYEVQNRNNPALPEGYYPATPAISKEEWEKIVNYYYQEAPDSLHLEYPPISAHLDRFEVKTPSYPNERPPVSCCVKIDPEKHAIYITDGIDRKLKCFNGQLEKVDEAGTVTVAVDIALSEVKNTGERLGLLLNMGALSPFDVTHGSLQQVSIDGNLKITLSSHLLIDGLPRPVHISKADLNGDKNEDLVICGFGNFTGELFWLRNTGEGHYEKKSLRKLPGAIQTLVTDMNGDGRLDILALMAQGDEGVFAYEQQPDGSFAEKRLLRFSPAAGSISIDLADFNRDGSPDLVYTSGDNADFSKILKPYHGVYLYRNDGKWNFKKEYFFPINGCFKAVAGDFDMDGDPDIAAISYFSDFRRRPEESFVYLQNEGDSRFNAFTFPQHSIGRWISMDAGDVDGDGDLDLVLGNMSIGPSNLAPNALWRKGPEFVLLKNKTK